MRYKNFKELKESVTVEKKAVSCVIIRADHAHALEAVIKARDSGLINPILIGNKEWIKNYFRDNAVEFDGKIHDEDNNGAAMQLGINLVQNKEADCMMKGLIPTSTFMSAVFKKENNLRTGSRVSMLSFREVPNYPKLIAFTDTGITPHPSFEQKIDIINDAVKALNDMGIHNPKVAVLAAAETPSSKMPESIDADNLKKLNESGEISNCIIEGPISLDLALSKEAAEKKGYVSKVAGDADLLVFPNLVSANLTTKMIAHITGEPAGVLILGTKAPVIVCSRSATVDTKVLCITLATTRMKKGEKNETNKSK